MSLEDLFCAVCPYTNHGTYTSKRTDLFWCILAEGEYSKERLDSASILQQTDISLLKSPVLCCLYKLQQFFQVETSCSLYLRRLIVLYPFLSFQLKLLKL